MSWNDPGDSPDGLGSVDNDAGLQCSQTFDDTGSEAMGPDTMFYNDLLARSQVLPPSRFRRDLPGGAERENDTSHSEREEEGEGPRCEGRSSQDIVFSNRVIVDKQADMLSGSCSLGSRVREEEGSMAAASSQEHPEEDSFILPLSQSKELSMYQWPKCFGNDKPTPQQFYTKGQLCSRPSDGYKYTTQPKRIIFPPGCSLTSALLPCCCSLHYNDIEMTVQYGNRVNVTVVLTHVAITRLMRVEAEEYFAAAVGSPRRKELVNLKHNVFRAIQEGPNPSLLCKSVNDVLRVTAIVFSYD